MALKLDYVVRETGSSLRRNLTLTLASILTVGVSLALAGVPFLLQKGVNNATQQWKGDVELQVFLQPKLDEHSPQTATIKRELLADPEVKKVTYLNHAAAYKEFLQIEKDNPDIAKSV